jgi:hypothetical protein
MTREGAADGRGTIREFLKASREAARNQATALRARGDLRTFDVTMLGSAGTGKTTLLASVYDRFDAVIGSTDLAVIPDHLTSVKLDEYITTLKSLPRTVEVRYGLPGTGEIREYRLGVGRKGKPSLFTLRFTDYPGKKLFSDQVNEEKEAILRALTRADVIMVAIDAPALMERNGKYHNLINRPRFIRDQIMTMLMADEARLIILVPLKCERYVGTQEEARRLTERVLEQYEPMLNFIRTGEVRSRVGCVLAPAQTVGSVVFNAISEEQPGQPVFHYHSRTANAKYRPVDTDQALRYALRFIVNKYRIERRGVIPGIWQAVFGTDAALVTAMDQFAAGCKNDGSFQVVQPHNFLQPGG